MLAFILFLLGAGLYALITYAVIVAAVRRGVGQALLLQEQRQERSAYERAKTDELRRGREGL